MSGPSYAEMEAYLDNYFVNADVSSMSVDAQGFLVQTYYIIKQLIADVQAMQKMLDEMNDFGYLSPSKS